MTQQRAFTLVELSIVLVMLGLLIGGVLTGQSLIRAAELRSIATQQARYITAVQTFRDKYFAIPGDMTNATSYWGAAASGATCITTASSDSKTCNGNGSGLVNNAASESNETYRFWQQLANAGLIEGQYDGITHGSTVYASTTLNSPAGRLSSSLWYAASYTSPSSGYAIAFDGPYDNFLIFGGTNANNAPIAPVLKPEEAYNVDMKVDDGKPATGKIVQLGNIDGAATRCTDGTSSAQLTANYLLTNTALSCALYVRQAF